MNSISQLSVMEAFVFQPFLLDVEKHVLFDTHISHQFAATSVVKKQSYSGILTCQNEILEESTHIAILISVKLEQKEG